MQENGVLGLLNLPREGVYLQPRVIFQLKIAQNLRAAVFKVSLTLPIAIQHKSSAPRRWERGIGKRTLLGTIITNATP